MKKILKFIPGSLILLLSLCTKPEPPLFPDPQTGSAIETGTPVSRTVIGEVIDELGNPVPGATVSIVNSETTTNANGVFTFYSTEIPSKHSFVQVEKDGFFKGIRSFVPTTGVNKVKIQLLRKVLIGTVANTGGTVNFDNVSIVFSGGFVDESGNTYNGNVRVYGKYIDPEMEEHLDQMPGNLRASDEGSETLLKTFGMVAVELTDLNGNILQPAEGKEAELKMSIPSSMLSDAPQTIDLWYFDETRGYWVNEGVAEKVGNEYIGNVAHFSFWNCDIKVPYAKCFGKLMDQYGTALSGIKVYIKSTVAGSRYAYTGSLGDFGGIIPSGVNLTICFTGGILGNEEFCFETGPFQDGDDLGTFTINLDFIEVSGSILNCEGIKSPGYVWISPFDLIESPDGDFAIKCLTNQTFNLYVTSADGNQMSSVNIVNVTDQPIDLGGISYCKQNQGVWNNKIIGMLVRYNLSSSTKGDSLYFSLVDMSVLEDYAEHILRLKIGKANGYNTNDYITLDLLGSYNGIGKYQLTESNTSKNMNLFTGNTANNVLDKYTIDLEIEYLNVSPGGQSRMTFSGTCRQYDPLADEYHDYQIYNGLIYFKMF